MLHGQAIESAKSFKEVWKEFLHFIEMNFNGKVILVAHNGFRFDGPVLVHNLIESGNPIPDYIVADTQPAFKSRYYLNKVKATKCNHWLMLSASLLNHISTSH